MGVFEECTQYDINTYMFDPYKLCCYYLFVYLHMAK